jgi:hypothetical protein
LVLIYLMTLYQLHRLRRTENPGGDSDLLQGAIVTYFWRYQGNRNEDSRFISRKSNPESHEYEAGLLTTAASPCPGIFYCCNDQP